MLQRCCFKKTEQQEVTFPVHRLVYVQSVNLSYGSVCLSYPVSVEERVCILRYLI